MPAPPMPLAIDNHSDETDSPDSPDSLPIHNGPNFRRVNHEQGLNHSISHVCNISHHWAIFIIMFKIW